MHQEKGEETKKAKEPFLLICDQLEVKSSECIMIGDWPERDVQGGKLAGMKTCLAKYGQAQPAKADHQINDFKELLDVVAECKMEKYPLQS